jgi:hypothetical protein
LSSWGSWAAEKRKQGWRAKAETPAAPPAAAPAAERVSVGERPHVTTVTELGRGAAQDTKPSLVGDKNHRLDAKDEV